MFREMRRKKQLLFDEEAIRILQAHGTGVLAVTGDDGYPYAVPVNYVYRDGRLYLHSAREGHKIDSIRRNDKVSFCVIDRDDVVQELFTTLFRSVIVFGWARILTDTDEHLSAFQSLVDKHSPDFPEQGQKEINNCAGACMIEIQIEHLTGKAAIEIVEGKV